MSPVGKIEETPRDLSWNDHYHMLFVDNPRGTGYSIADKDSYVTTEDEVAEDFLNALINFYLLEPFQMYNKTPLFIFGESYAGHYVPSIAKKILENNLQPESERIPLAGIAVGDGFTDPINQLPENAIFGYALGLLNEKQRAEVELYQLNAAGHVINGKYLEARDDIDKVMDTITSYGGGLNVYNFRNFGDYDFSNMVSFFNSEDVVNRYNVDPSVAGQFQDINEKVYDALSLTDFMQSVVDRVIYVLEAGLPTMFYNGQDDIICNTPSVQNWIAQMEWAGQGAFYQTPFNIWIYENGTNAGLQKNYENLYFVIINKAGHLSPMDQIETTTEMTRRFVL